MWRFVVCLGYVVLCVQEITALPALEEELAERKILFHAGTVAGLPDGTRSVDEATRREIIETAQQHVPSHVQFDVGGDSDFEGSETRQGGFRTEADEGNERHHHSHRNRHNGSRRHGHNRQSGEDESGFPDNEGNGVTNDTGYFRQYPDNCQPDSHCYMREQAKQYRLDSLKQEILSKLRLKNPPNMTGRKLPRVPALDRLLEQLGENQMQGDDPYAGHDKRKFEDDTDRYHANTERVINFCRPPAEHLGLGINRTNACHFTFQPQVMQSKIKSAQFWVYTRPTTRHDVVLLIYMYKAPSRPGDPLIKELIEEKKFQRRHRNGAWHHFSFTAIVQKWVKHPESNYGISVEAVDYNGKSLPIITAKNEKEEYYLPVMHVRIQDQSQNRRKRNAGLDCHEQSNEERCCRYPMSVSFEEFGWDWVIAPKDYDANYCFGDCPYIFHQRYLHTHITSLAATRHGPGTGGAKPPGPCCTPSKVYSLSMLYFDESNNIVFGVLPGVKVGRCNCA